MGRRVRLAHAPSSPPPSPVVVRSLIRPRGAWNLVDAVRMAAMGYPLHTAAARTGYPAPTIAAYRIRGTRCEHVEHVEAGGELIGRSTFDLEAPWSTCHQRDARSWAP